MKIHTRNRSIVYCAILFLNLFLNKPGSFAQTGDDSAVHSQANAQVDAVSSNSKKDATPKTFSDDERRDLEAQVKVNPKDLGRLRDLAVIYLQSSKTAEKGKQIIETS